jgi:predicted  nucleic acid-binding Zn-ribbon protein
VQASPIEQKELLRLQDLHTRLAQVNHQTRSLPEIAEIARLSRDAEIAGMTLLTRSGEVDDVSLELRRIESDVEVVEKRIKRDNERLAQSSSVKDVQAFETELAALSKRLDALEEIEIAVMERLEEREAAAALAEADRQTVLAQIAELETIRDAQLEGLNRELGELARDRAAIEAGINAELLALYENRRVVNHGSGAALMRARTCNGCNMTISGSDLEAVRSASAQEVIFCPDCGTILVRTEESGI